MLKTALQRLSRGLRTESSPGHVQLPLPPTLPASLGCDAVGIPAEHGFRLMARLPRKGCIFADADWWWWIVPAGSDLDLTWPSPARYVAGTTVPAAHPRLIHWPEDPTPYTPPIPFYLMVCQLTGTAPSWTPDGTAGTVPAQRG
ncbi:hypothetical protein [Streptomyces sp. 35G-GA-8]|uniref:hypothetical protein n=1 Tax=Streptomyces sp. 35G-GA-8 TaxID=2939434 RepID=UPI00201F3845|nr:hypothetical protein [Streptomyces sp. 35G-GA-8]MCL7375427.1 hypothetical protein [Streptomyces sp. 35G-GA-8]